MCVRFNVPPLDVLRCGDANAIYTSQRALRGHWPGEEVGLGAGSDKSGDDLTNLTAYFR